MSCNNNYDASVQIAFFCGRQINILSIYPSMGFNAQQKQMHADDDTHRGVLEGRSRQAHGALLYIRHPCSDPWRRRRNSEAGALLLCDALHHRLPGHAGGCNNC